MSDQQAFVHYEGICEGVCEGTCRYGRGMTKVWGGGNGLKSGQADDSCNPLMGHGVWLIVSRIAVNDARVQQLTQ